MSKQTKEPKPAQVDLSTRNQNDHFSEIERLVLDVYGLVLDGFIAPTSVAEILPASLKMSLRSEAQLYAASTKRRMARPTPIEPSLFCMLLSSGSLVVVLFDDWLIP
jgi:hypothetical protein